MRGICPGLKMTKSNNNILIFDVKILKGQVQ